MLTAEAIQSGTTESVDEKSSKKAKSVNYLT